VAAGSKEETSAGKSLKDRYIEIYGHASEGGEANV
jgi:hypothetical protein